MDNTLEKCLLFLCYFAGIMVFCIGVSLDYRLHPTRFRRQSEGVCQRLRNPAHGKYIDLYNTSLEQPLLPLSSVLWYICDEGYKLFPKNTLLICLRDGTWSQDPPTCSRKCPALHSTATTIVQCFDKNKAEIKCDEASDGSVAQFECAVNYVLASDSHIPFSICWSGSWNLPPPQCVIPACPPLKPTSIVKIQCFDKYKIEIKCDEATDESTAKFQCAPYYEPADKNRTLLHCSSRSWDQPAPQCIPVCGEKKESDQVNHKGHYPWATAIFSKTKDGFINTCVGSMLTQKVILTAAHCVTIIDGLIKDQAKFKVAVGKYYNKYMDERDTQVQYSDVELILVHPKFKGLSQHYSSDIAFLITKDTLELSEVVQPVCFRNLPNIVLPFGEEGTVTGWGLTVGGEGPSEKLKEVSVRLTDPSCVAGRIFPPVWLDEYNDKFCAGKYNGSIDVCAGDSGGGLVIKNPKDDRFYVHGIVSVGGPTNYKNVNGRCVAHSISLFTKVAIHYNWLQQIVSQYTKL